MLNRSRLGSLCALVLMVTGCYREHTADEDAFEPESDASSAVASDAGAAVAPDAGCSGQDALSQLVCQLGQQGARADSGATQQQSLQDLLNGLAGLTGGRDAGAGAIDLQDLLDGLLGAGGGLGGAGGTSGRGGVGGAGITRRDAGRPEAPTTPATPGWGGFGRRDAGTAPPPAVDAATQPESSDAGAEPLDEPEDASVSDASVSESADGAVAAP